MNSEKTYDKSWILKGFHPIEEYRERIRGVGKRQVIIQQNPDIVVRGFIGRLVGVSDPGFRREIITLPKEYLRISTTTHRHSELSLGGIGYALCGVGGFFEISPVIPDHPYYANIRERVELILAILDKEDISTESARLCSLLLKDEG